MEWLTSAPEKLGHSIVQRPYVFAFFVVYLVLATAHLGGRRVLWMTVVGYWLAWASEFASIRIGFPYGLYHYLEPALEHDLMVAGVPFFDSLSYTFLAYFAWASAIYLRGHVRFRRRFDLRFAEHRNARRSVATLVLAAFLMTWMDVALDPITHLGDRWFLGKIYEYAADGLHFGVPLSNYVGWLLTGSLIVAAYQRIDGAADASSGPVGRSWPGQACYGPLAYVAVVAFALIMTFAIGERRMGWTGLALQAPVLLAFAIRFWRARRVNPAAP